MPNTTKNLEFEKAQSIIKMIEKFEEDDDVQNVFHNLEITEEIIRKYNFMNVLIIGSGGREHAIAWKISKSSMIKKLIVCPGNAGTELVAKNIELDINDFNKIKLLCIEEEIDIVIVGPEDPLVNGISDYFKLQKELNHVTLIGPCKKAAQLEGSKRLCKRVHEKI